MKKLKNLIALTAVMAMLASPAAYSQEYAYDAETEAYDDSSDASRLSVLIPVGALVVAGIIIATTNRGHHHHHNRSSSSSSSHAHSSSSF